MAKVIMEYLKNGVAFKGTVEDNDEYLREYGWKQSVADSHAGSFKKVEKDWAEKAKAAGTTFDPKAKDFLAAVDVQIEADIRARIKKIEDGTMDVRESDPLRSIAVELLRKNASEKGKKLPDGKTPEYKALVASVLEKHRVAIQKEYDRRQKTVLAIEL